MTGIESRQKGFIVYMDTWIFDHSQTQRISDFPHFSVRYSLFNDFFFYHLSPLCPGNFKATMTHFSASRRGGLVMAVTTGRVKTLLHFKDKPNLMSEINK
ncbi:hypothetical protein XENORESO_001631 [Xenotaenia resolanae]|uniref:Uncharacterized protein n=1 Tax=Xenotaenia resolanae TaxID=208358 RepID=A0ABV0WHZ2_9TELE